MDPAGRLAVPRALDGDVLEGEVPGAPGLHVALVVDPEHLAAIPPVNPEAVEPLTLVVRGGRDDQVLEAEDGVEHALPALADRERDGPGGGAPSCVAPEVQEPRHLGQPRRGGEVRVDCRRPDVDVAEDFLDELQVRAAGPEP